MSLLFALLPFAQAACPAGQSVTDDTAGHCCWAGQAWNGEVCVGLPARCPEGTVTDPIAQRCVPPGEEVSRGYSDPRWRLPYDPALRGDCPEGQHQVSGDHCCPAGQGWSTPMAACVSGGLPTEPGVLGVMRDASELDAVFGGSPETSTAGSSAQTTEGANPSAPSASALGAATVTLERDTIILGALDKALIDAVVAENMPHIEACYASGLEGAPKLAGRVVVKFVISKAGTVTSSVVKSTTLGDDAVATCMATAFAQMQFAEPKGGGIVIASYPFLLSPG